MVSSLFRRKQISNDNNYDDDDNNKLTVNRIYRKKGNISSIIPNSYFLNFENYLILYFVYFIKKYFL